jgi:membrane protein DedA with SNARE-associated domain
MAFFVAAHPMFETLLRQFEGSPLSLWGPFLILILCGLGLPIPEDIVLVAAGALGVIDGRSWVEVSVVMYAGVMLGDSMIFFAGRYLGQRLMASPWFQRYFSVKKQAKVEAQFERFGSMVLFVGRFLPGLRAPIFFTAGSLKTRYWKFFFFDGLAALVSVPFFVWLGSWIWTEFQDDLAQLQHALSRTQSYTMIVALFIGAIVVVAIYVQLRRLRAERERESDDKPDAS